MDRFLISVYKLDKLRAKRERAERIGAGLELNSFADPDLLAGDMERAIASHKRLLDGFKGVIGFHGAFYDLVSASPDPDVVSLTRKRYRQNLQAAAALGGRYIVFHANYMGGFKLANYRQGWHKRQVKFWREFAAEAADQGIYVLLENMWADDPSLIADIFYEVDNPYFRACLDFAHATLFSPYPPSAWIDMLEPYLHLCHLNNHDGKIDCHWALGEGVVRYSPILRHLRHLPQPPMLTLEMPTWRDIRASLPYLELPAPGDASHSAAHRAAT